MVAEQATRLRLVTDEPSDDGKRICSQCVNGAMSVFGVYCTLYREDINNERVAEECEEFETC